MIRMAVLDGSYPCATQLVRQPLDGSVKVLEFPEPLTLDDVDRDKFPNWSRKDPTDWEFVGYESVPVFRMTESAAVRLAAGDDE